MKVMNFEFSHIYGKHFLTSPYECGDDVIPSQLITHIIHEIVKIFLFFFGGGQMQVQVYLCIEIF